MFLRFLLEVLFEPFLVDDCLLLRHDVLFSNLLDVKNLLRQPPTIKLMCGLMCFTLHIYVRILTILIIIGLRVFFSGVVAEVFVVRVRIPFVGELHSSRLPQKILHSFWIEGGFTIEFCEFLRVPVEEKHEYI